ncbi:ABC transporter substrate-binding protein [Peribacillus sp. FSL H8-0477]|uniref:ABC transporter substrate-binding protein n=1 Tax=Peribacillus sp. FSL H8-0477 TaxID=2921388 RepID=UPI0030FAC471
MKKWILFLVAALMVVLTACGNEDSASNEPAKEKDDKKASDTITYEAESGPIKVPSDPQRVVILSGYVGDMLELGINVVGMDSWSFDHPDFAKKYPDAEVVESSDFEKILELNPDLIIGSSDIEDADKLQEIAPTVLYTYGAVDYIEQRIEIGKVVNKEKEMRAWVKDFQTRAKELGEKIKAKIGEDATVTIAGNSDKQIYLFGDSWGRGTEIIYQEMGLEMPKAVKDVVKPGYFGISEEVLGDYVGDYFVLNLLKEGQDTSFLKTDWYNDIPAVKNKHVFYAEGSSFIFADAYSFDYQLDFFEKSFLGN